VFLKGKPDKQIGKVTELKWEDKTKLLSAKIELSENQHIKKDDPCEAFGMIAFDTENEVDVTDMAFYGIGLTPIRELETDE
jgi:hypothetical protein